MNTEIRKPIIGFTSGDLNGIGLELIIKSLSDSRILDFTIPVVFANNKSLNFYRKGLPEFNLSFTVLNDLSKLSGQKLVMICPSDPIYKFKSSSISDTLEIKNTVDADIYTAMSYFIIKKIHYINTLNGFVEEYDTPQKAATLSTYWNVCNQYKI